MIGQLLISGLLIGGIYALLGIGLTLTFGVLKIVNFAHGEFLMVAMYAVFWLFTLYHIDPYISLLLIIPLLAGFGWVVFKFLLRRTIGKKSIVQLFVTVGLGVFLQNIALLAFKGDYRTIQVSYSDSVWKIGSSMISVPRLIAFLVVLSIALAMYFFLKRTYTGKAMRATAEDRDAAMLMGINIERIYRMTFAVGTGLVGVAGALLMPIYYVFPDVGVHFVLIAFVTVILGGLGSVPGAILGGLIIGLVEVLSGFYIAPALQQAVYFTIFVVVLLIRPAGIFGRRGEEEIGFE